MKKLTIFVVVVLLLAVTAVPGLLSLGNIAVVQACGLPVCVDHGVLHVAIDIKPGSDPNCFNNDGKGVIPVAILGGQVFEPGNTFNHVDLDGFDDGAFFNNFDGFILDVTQIDPGSVALDSAGVKMAGKSGKLLAHIEDVNGDGIDDLVVQIQDVDGSFANGETFATLTGTLFDGTHLVGHDLICIVP